MREGAEVNDDGFAQMIAGLVERHPALCYRMVLEDSHMDFVVCQTLLN